ncbi:MAG: NADH-quinone oxidoreductase subunit L, partial [Pseudomonadota bacterium]
AVGDFRPAFGLHLDGLSLTMLGVITGVGFLIHLFASWYMRGEEGYSRFFSYMNLFVASMVLLVLGNNLMMLYLGWEGVGVCSYLLIGFYYRTVANGNAALKAFIVTRVGDVFMAIGMFILLQKLGTLDIQEMLRLAPQVFTSGDPAITWATLMLLGGAVGKSAQLPLQTWLADAMAGPTPVSALIHAATMVTAGVYLIARLNGLFVLAPDVMVLVGATGALTLLMAGLCAMVQTDIKRVLAYSTMSQIGYMFLALGAGAWQAAVFHLMTHAFFKALLFLAAGSVIIGMHHDQDIRNMGGLRRHMPLTWITSLLGSLALIGTPLFSGFYSKDSILIASHHSALPGATFAMLAVYAGVFVTAFYSFRMYFLVFHGEERFRHKPFPPPDDHGHDDHHAHTPHESPWVVTAPLVLLAVPSVVIGFMTIQPMLFGEFLKDAITVDAGRHPAMAALAEGFHGPSAMALHGLVTLPLYLALAGVVCAWWFYLKQPSIPAAIARALRPLVTVLENKYYMDWINEHLLAAGARRLGTGLWKGGDQAVIDGAIDGSARGIGALAGVMRRWQTGRLYQYALVMLLGIFGLLTWQLWPFLGGLLR